MDWLSTFFSQFTVSARVSSRGSYADDRATTPAKLAAGALLGWASVMLVLLYEHSRAFFAMANDGLLPKLGRALSQASLTACISVWFGLNDGWWIGERPNGTSHRRWLVRALASQLSDTR